MNLQKYYNKDKIEVGVDEVGRGCLFGRVYAASVILPQDFEENTYKEIKDSKKLSKKKREYLSDYIKDIAIDWSVSYLESNYIDKYNIYNASMKAMHLAIDNLNVLSDGILVDGDKFKPYMDREENYVDYYCFPKGDDKYLSIASASILAKVERDNWIEETVHQFPTLQIYDMLNNKGYGTRNHLLALRNYGLTPWHRKTFGICKSIDKINTNFK